MTNVHDLVQFPILWLDPGVAFLLPFPGKSLGLFGLISSPSSIAFEFSADRGSMHSDCFSNFCLAKSCFQKRENMVSLVGDKL